MIKESEPKLWEVPGASQRDPPARHRRV